MGSTLFIWRGIWDSLDAVAPLRKWPVSAAAAAETTTVIMIKAAGRPC